jgi:hypothetical protein
VIAYLRSMPAAASVSESETSIDFPISFFMKLAPKPLNTAVSAPPRSDTVAYGKYLTTVAGCRSCHSPVDDKHQIVVGKEFSGGQEFASRWFTVRSSNLTPHATGLTVSKEAFIARFHATETRRVKPTENTVMPWLAFKRMSDEDLGAIHDYLASLAPIDNAVVTRP